MPFSAKLASASSIRSPYDAMPVLEKIEYAFWNETNKEPINPSDKRLLDYNWMNENCRVLVQYETLEKKIGTCFETALLMRCLFCDYPNRVFYLSTTDTPGSLGYSNHLGVVVNFSEKFYWVEYSWYKYRGVYGSYYQEEHAFEAVKSIYRNEFRKDIIFNPNFIPERLYRKDRISLEDIRTEGEKSLC